MIEFSDQNLANHEFRINFYFKNKSFTASVTIVQKEDHDEYFIFPNDAALATQFGNQIIYIYITTQISLWKAGTLKTII